MQDGTPITSRLSMSDRTADRRERLRASLTNDDVDAILIAAPTNVRYLTGFSGEDSTLIVTRERAIVVSDGRFATQLTQECPDLEHHIRSVGQLMAPGLVEIIPRLGITRLSFEADTVTVADFESLQGSLPSVELKPVIGPVESLRVVKDDGEIADLRAAIAMAEAAFAEIRTMIRPGATEKAIADELEARLRRHGARGACFPTIVAVGPNAALPHHRASDSARIGEDDIVLIDWGADGGPYKSDLTRVVTTGKVTHDFEVIYRTVLAAQERAIAAIRPGAKAGEIDAVARTVIDEAGFGAFFTHGLGHGLGMDVHEAPRLRRQSEVALQPGMVVTIEPGIYRPEWGGVRIEDDVLVTPDGAEVLTRVPKSLESVRV